MIYEIILVMIILSIMMIGSATRKIIPRRRHPYRESSMLLSAMADGKLINGNTGLTPNGMTFTYLISQLSLGANSNARGLYMIELPFKSKAHLLGVPVEGVSILDQNNVNSIMHELVLEGDYPNYFHLYAGPDQEHHGRYVLDPKAMSFTVDFCREFQWEILDDALYFMSSGPLPSLEIVDEFIRQIRPAIELSTNRRQNPFKLPYNISRAHIIKCPICEVVLMQKESRLECPNGHGCLMTGKAMINLRKAAVDDGRVFERSAKSDGIQIKTDRLLTCPYCSGKMKHSHYQHTDVAIDICSRCAYRWLDATDLPFFTGIDKQIRPL